MHTAAKKKETTMSQMTSFVNALKACGKVSTFVKTAVVTAKKAQAPVGRGSKTRPAEYSCHFMILNSLRKHLHNHAIL